MMKNILAGYLYNRAGFKAYRLHQSPLSSIAFDVIGPPGVGKSFFIKALISGGVVDNRPHRFSKEMRVCSSRSKLLSLLALNRDDLEVLRRKSAKLLYDLNIMSSSSHFIIDEGICHHFAGELIQLSETSREDFLTIMRGRGVINLTAPPEIITSRIGIRYRRTGKLLDFHKEKSEHELHEYNSTALHQREELCGLMREAGCPTITLDVSQYKFTKLWIKRFRDMMVDADAGISGCHPE